MTGQIASNWANGGFWTIVVFIGGFALLAAMIWAWAKNRKITPEENRRTEDATRELYKTGTTDETTRR